MRRIGEAVRSLLGRGGGPVTAVMPEQRDTIVFFPDYTSGNPYQTLMYAPCRQAGFTVVPGDIGLALEQRNAARVIFHLHWLNALFKGLTTEAAADAAADAFIDQVTRFQAAGGHVLWTIHNRQPHEQVFLNQDLRLRRFLSTCADRIHLHCASHLAELSHLPLNRDRITVHRHGNYIGHYGPFNLSDRQDEFDRNGLRALFLGALRPYKGIGALSDVVRSLRAAGIPVTIAGQPGTRDVQRQIAALGDETGAATLLRRVEDEEVHDLCRGHSIGILSYDRILTSGTLKLYLGYGMMVVAPPAPTIRSEDRFGTFLYTPPADGSDADIGQRLRAIEPDRVRQIFECNYRIAEDCRWSESLFRA